MRPFPFRPLLRLAAFLSLLSGPVSAIVAQQLQDGAGALEDVLYLRGGSSVRGRIVSYVHEQYVKIEMLGGSVLVYQMSEVGRMTREPAREPWWIDYGSVARNSERSLRPVQYWDRGVFHGFAVGMAFGENRWGGLSVNLQLQCRAGFRLSPHAAAGAAIGLDWYPEEMRMIPLMLDVHGDLHKRRRTTLHYTAQAGYGASAGSLPSDFTALRGGPTGYLGMGPKFHTRSRSEIAVTIGYKAQRTYQEIHDANGGGWDPFTGQPIPFRFSGTRTYQRMLWQMTVFF